MQMVDARSKGIITSTLRALDTMNYILYYSSQVPTLQVRTFCHILRCLKNGKISKIGLRYSQRFKWVIPGLFFIYFCLFKQTLQFFATNICGKMLGPSRIWRRDLNQRHSEHESSPITTRPGLPPNGNLKGLAFTNLHQTFV